ncbi:MAG TPA: hypothetical protein DIW41_01510, partial [Lachnospiraceae bacterium]|nr:hypothetical protein [Lachnospiraceae bacterium]
TPKPTPKPTVTPTPGTADSGEIVKKVTVKGKVKANSLNVRSGPGTTYPKVGGLVTGQSVTVINEALSDSEKWYAVTFSDGKQTISGYVLSLYIEPDYTKAIKGEVGVSKAKIRSSAGSKASYLKNKAGNIISLKKGKSVSIVGEKIVGKEKWYKFTFTSEDKKKTGYAPASQILFRKTVKEPTKAPTPTPNPTNKPTKAPTPTEAPTPTKKPEASVTPTPAPKPTKAPTPTPEHTKAPTPTPTKAPTPTEAPADDILTVANVEIHRNITSPLNGYVCNTIYLNVMDNILASQNMLLDNKNEIVVINNGQKVTVTGDVSVDNVVWYKITFSYNYQILSGFVRAEYIYIGEERPVSDDSVTIPGGTVTPTPTPITGDPANLDFEVQLALENFPESYKASLRQLHAQYPNWIFKAYHTGLYWDTVIAEENVPARNLIPNNKSVEWKSLMEGAYNWKNDTFIVFDGSTWVTASKEAIEYYMDPRNFLTTECIFQFELLKYQENYQNITGIESILKGTAMSNAYYSFLDESGMQRSYSYGETFLEAAKYSGVSPYHLASRVKQEVVTGPYTLSGSVSGTYPGYEGYYNFYNIGANDSAGGGAIKNGLKFAKNGTTNAATNALYMIPWTNPYRAIVGGSYFLGNGYINRGQDTIYLQKFNVTPKSTYYHQYMTNVEAPWAEGRKVSAAYLNMTDTPIVFSIPVYLNMPSQPAPRPTTKFNPNNRLKSLKVLDMNATELTITPTFSQTEYNYFLIVPEDVTTIEIKAATVSKKATLGGGGFVQLADGNNEIVIPVIAENGDVAEYTINIVRE